MKVHHQPPEIRSIKIRGFVTEYEKNKWFSFDIRPKNRDFRDELKKLRPRFQKVENGNDKYFRPVLKNSMVHLIYLNWESANGLYKDPKNNLPYEVLDITGSSTIYRQSRTERKEDILKNLEKIAVEEGLKNTN